MKRHSNLSVFVPHVGCPQRCSFCDQQAISGAAAAPGAEEVTALCSRFLPAPGQGQNTEIAFFGGSFTAIPRDYMNALLAAAQPFLKEGRAAGIRISTRPDAVDGPVLRLLKQNGVTSVELGAQSMIDEVLQKNLRGHTSADVKKAAFLVKEAGFSLGLQMMVGLPFEKNAEEAALATAKQLIALSPDTVRIYPALTLKNTQMASWYEQGLYQPLSLQSALSITAKLLCLFEEAGVRVIRVGLHADESLKNSLLAGPYHPAFRQLCEAERYRREIARALAETPAGAYTIKVASGELSTAQGQKKQNASFFLEKGFLLCFAEDTALQKGQFKIE